MIFSPDRIHQRRQAGILLSLASHAAVLLIAFLFTLHFGRVRPVYRQSRCCTAALYWTGNTGISDASPAAPRLKHSIASPVPIPKSSLIENPIHLRQPRTPPHPAPAQNNLAQAGIPSRQQQQTIGNGSGSDDAEPAFPTYFPRPAVTDRSLLPAAEQKIIVDVTISDKGDVTDEKLVQGLGNNLDDLVMKTVKSWRFHPATLNGNNIASVEQLVFPFNRDYPSDDSSNAWRPDSIAPNIEPGTINYETIICRLARQADSFSRSVKRLCFSFQAFSSALASIAHATADPNMASDTNDVAKTARSISIVVFLRSPKDTAACTSGLEVHENRSASPV